MFVADVPAAVAFTAKLKDGEVTLRWSKPNDKGANITEYSVYQRTENNEQWKKIAVLSDVSKLEHVVKVEKGKKYQFVVTATNKYGESSKNKDNIKEVDVLGGKSYDDVPFHWFELRIRLCTMRCRLFVRSIDFLAMKLKIIIKNR